MDYSIIENKVYSKLEELGYDNYPSVQQAPSNDLGDFSLVVNRIARDDVNSVAKELKASFEQFEEFRAVEIFETKGKKKRPGIVYLNFKLEDETRTKLREQFVKNSLKTVFSKKYGQLSTNKGKTAIVEHTSANPISPIHVGNLRNSIHGDTYARILKASGYKVFKHFYVNDVGLQVAFTVIGFEILKSEEVRPDQKN